MEIFLFSPVFPGALVWMGDFFQKKYAIFEKEKRIDRDQKV